MGFLGPFPELLEITSIKNSNGQIKGEIGPGLVRFFINNEKYTKPKPDRSKKTAKRCRKINKKYNK